MKKVLLAAMAAVIGFTSCQKESITTPSGKEGVTVVKAGAGSSTRIHLEAGTDASGEDVITWKTGDKIKFFEIQAKGTADPDYPATSAYPAGGFRVLGTDTAPAIIFTLANGAGETEAEFWADGVGLDPEKLYIACHASRSMDDFTTSIEGSGKFFCIRQHFNGGPSYTVATEDAMRTYCEDRCAFYAFVSFVDEETIAPIEFLPLTPVIEYRLTQSSMVPGDFVVRAISMTVNPSATTFGSQCNFDFTEDLTPAYRAYNAYPSTSMTLTYAPPLPKEGSDPLVIRIPAGWRQAKAGNGEGNKSFNVALSVSPAGDLTQTLFVREIFTKNPGAGVNAFPAGGTYVKDFVVMGPPGA